MKMMKKLSKPPFIPPYQGGQIFGTTPRQAQGGQIFGTTPRQAQGGQVHAPLCKGRKETKFQEGL